jgi:tetratricopeptide (TPR) repeat protein
MNLKMSRLLRAELIVLLCILILKAVDVQTNCVLNGTARFLKQVVRIDPLSEFAYNALGHTYYGLDQVEEGDKAFNQATLISYERAIQKNPDDAQTWFNLGHHYHYLDNMPAKSIRCYEKAVRLDSSWPAAWEFLGNAYADTGQEIKAITAYKESLALDFDDRLSPSGREIHGPFLY